MEFLAISGSLRAASSNSRLIAALPRLCAPGDSVLVFDGLNDLPHFNPDLDGDLLPPVRRLRQAVGASDGLIICSPEYAHGVAGVMKNALDWLVPSVEFPEKPVALLNAAPHAHHAQDHIRETLTMMQARFVEAACVPVPLPGRNLDSDGIVGDPELSALLSKALNAFSEGVAAMAPAPDWS